VTDEATVVGQIVDVMKGLGYIEAVWPDFSRTPDQVTDGAFAVELTEPTTIGQIGYFEEVKAIAQIEWLRPTNNNQPATRARMLTDARSIVSAVVRDGMEYAVEDVRGMVTEFPKGASFCKATIRLPINFEAAL
jgi:hypothetical protein